MTANQQQCEAWNGSESLHWVDHADRYDRQFTPLADALFTRLDLEPRQVVLDVGCGCGALTLRAAGAARFALGADISEPLVGVASGRARSASVANAEFVVADAQTHAFTEGSFDVVLSQLGLMFFDEPAVAFANLRRSLAQGGRLAFTCWQRLEANEWVSIVAEAVAKHVVLSDLGGQIGGPGMFSLKNPEEIAALLEAVDFSQIEIEPIAPTCLIGGGGSLEESIDFLLGMGIVRGLLGHADPDSRIAAIKEIRGALTDHFESGLGIQLGTAAWLVSADR